MEEALISTKKSKLIIFPNSEIYIPIHILHDVFSRLSYIKRCQLTEVSKNWSKYIKTYHSIIEVTCNTCGVEKRWTKKSIEDTKVCKICGLRVLLPCTLCRSKELRQSPYLPEHIHQFL